MFICGACVEQFEGPAITYAKTLDRLVGSHGPCEICHKVSMCTDIPSSANWWRKKDAE